MTTTAGHSAGRGEDEDDGGGWLLREFVADPRIGERWRRHVHPIPLASGCLIWTGAISAGGHGRFWLGRRPDGRDLVIVAHRFGYALHHGIDALLTTEVIRHTCDEPSCQNPTHWAAGTTQENTLEWANRRWNPGSPLRDIRGARGRAEALRTAALTGTNLDHAAAAGKPLGDPTPRPPPLLVVHEN